MESLQNELDNRQSRWPVWLRKCGQLVVEGFASMNAYTVPESMTDPLAYEAHTLAEQVETHLRAITDPSQNE